MSKFDNQDNLALLENKNYEQFILNFLATIQTLEKDNSFFSSGNTQQKTESEIMDDVLVF